MCASTSIVGKRRRNARVRSASVLVLALAAATWAGNDAAIAEKPARQVAQAAESASQAAPPGFVPLTEIEANWQGVAHKDRIVIIEQLLRMQEVDAAERLIQRLDGTGEEEKLLRQFYLGMVAKLRGRNGEAIAVFRGLLADNPQFERVRLELAHTLYTAEQDEAARHHFEQLLGANAANPDLSAMARGYISAIDSRRLWDFSTWVSFAPSTNFNQGTDSRSISLNGLDFALADRNVKKSGIGVVLGAQGSYRLPITSRLDAIASVGANFKRYRDGEFNDGFLNGTFGPRFRFDGGHIGIYGTADRRWLGDDLFSRSAGGLISSLVQVSPQDLVFTDLSCSRRRFADLWSGMNLTVQDGPACIAATRLEHHFDTSTFVNLLASVGRERAGLENLNNKSYSLGLGVNRELPLGVTVYVQGQLTKRSYEGVAATIDEARRDHRYDVTVNLTKRDLDLFGLAPMVTYNYTLNDSNVSYQAFDAHGISLTMTKRF
jgi:tetratricopeptide (TPR) repeat protein